VREQLVEWLHTKDPSGIPRTRVELVEQQPRPRTRSEPHPDTGGLFTGTPEAEERASQFTGAVPIVDPTSSPKAQR
jgi:hypothetical protein